MNKVSLKELTDDILLLVRNNNISESEDFSRAQVHSWIKQYKHKLWKDELDRRKDLARSGSISIDDLIDNEFVLKKETGPLELVDVSNDKNPNHTKMTVLPLEGVLDNSENNILAVHDQDGEVIQYMSHTRRHYHYFRKYTFGEMTAYYKDDGHIYVQGLVDKNELKYIYVLALYEDDGDLDNDDDMDEDDVKVPAWMVPDIKNLIIKNELAFMLNRPSDDSNNATLASVKPHGPQDDEE